MTARIMEGAVHIKFFVALSLLQLLGAQYYEGDACTLAGGAAGACAAFGKCPAAIEMIKSGKSPQTCSFSGREPIVCCPRAAAATTARPAPLSTAAPPRRTTTPYVPPVNNYEFEDPRASECPPIAAEKTKPKTGRKAWDKCIEYQEIIYPCKGSVSLAADDELVRMDYCGHEVIDLIIDGIDAKEREFPHMAMLGYGADLTSLSWLCGGTLISDRFVLTAGHCTFSRDFGNVTYVRIGALRRSQPVDAGRTYAVAEVIKHPQYRPPGKYNDIALLRTAQAMALDQFAVPACLHTGGAVGEEKALATGWGATQYRGANADVLQKVVLEKFTTSECRSKFPPGERNMREGFQEATQHCYGDHTLKRDTCQGDSGGPLQVYNRDIYCMYTLVGVTSFGKACGFAGTPGVYTRVSPFTPWIESVVWP